MDIKDDGALEETGDNTDGKHLRVVQRRHLIAAS
jgi:hypothetical protein